MQTTVVAPKECHLQSSLSPFCVLPDYKARYPATVRTALANLYREYNEAFAPLVEENREWREDYQFAVDDRGCPCNFAVQIDLVGLDEEFLATAAGLSEPETRKLLRRKIFEVENSLAMYQLLERLFFQEGEGSVFHRGWRAALAELRERFNKPIALLAVTEEKYEIMLATEFGRAKGEPLADEEVYALSGFNRFFGPAEFAEYLREKNYRCEYLLFVRSSDPIAKLRKPDVVEVHHPLLANPRVRRIIKANALTFNIDDPATQPGELCRINDTKAYMPPMKLAHPVYTETDVYSPEVIAYMKKGHAFTSFEGLRLNISFIEFLREWDVEPEEIAAGRRMVRLKPMQASYGGYGHLRGTLDCKDLRRELRRELKRRGPYIAQPELELPVWGEYAYIDRVFYAYLKGEPTFIGGFRSLMPLDCPEVRAGRNHGSRYTVWAEIVAD
jgi:hypothetical protein